MFRRGQILALALFGAWMACAAEPFDGPASVTASVAPGFYADGVEVALAYGDPAAEIHYTLDGSEPTAELRANCLRYSAPLAFADASSAENRLSQIPANPSDKISVTQNGKNYKWTAPTADGPNAHILRARAFREGRPCTNELAGTWLVGTVPCAHRLRVVSLQTDETNLFGAATGILVPGNLYTKWSGSVGKPYANYFQSGTNWERIVHCEIFETNRARVVAQTLGVRVHGAWSRAWPQKTLAFYARDEYGKKKVKYPLFPDDAETAYKRFLLRNSGNDWNETTFRDAVSQALFRPVARHATQGYVPAVVYINGEYWGIQNFRHAYGARFFERAYGADPDNVDYVKWATGLEAAEGDLVAYNELIAYMNAHSAADAEAYAEISRRIDIDNLIDYCILHAYVAATDWANNNNNVGLWRERVAYTNDAAPPHDGRWRFCSYDTDSGSALAGTKSTDGLANAKKLPMFKFLCSNADFVNRFVNRAADLMNTVLLPAAAQAKVDAAAAAIADEIPRHIARWPNLVSAASWTNEVAKFRQFFADRPAYMRTHLNTHFGTGACRAFTLEATAGGGVEINTLSSVDAAITLPWTGSYFENVPVTLRAVAEPGWEFVGWVNGATTNTAETVQVSVAEWARAKAVFRPLAPPHVVLNEVMADTEGVDWFELFNAGTNAVNLRGCWLSDDNAKHLTRIPCDAPLAAGAFQLVRADDGFEAGRDADGALRMPFGLGKKGDEIHLFAWDGTNEIASVAFGAQTRNVSEGAVPDGDETWGACGAATPGAPNRGPSANGNFLPNGCATQVWAGVSGRWQVDVTNRLADAGAERAVTTGWSLAGGAAIGAAIDAQGVLTWQVPRGAPCAHHALTVTWTGTLAGTNVTDATAYLVTSLGPKPRLPPVVTNVVRTIFAQPGYVWGRFSKDAPDTMTYVTTARRLAFPGATLAELAGCTFGGWMNGRSCGAKNARAYFVKGGADFLATTVQCYDDKHVKGVVVKLTEGDGGVFAQGLTAIYRTTGSGDLATTDFLTVADDGTIGYRNQTAFNTIATSSSTEAYGLCAFNAMTWLMKTNTTVFAGGRLDALTNCTFSGVMGGSAISPVKYATVTGRNVRVTRDAATGRATRIVLEMQHADDGYIKCPVVELTEGAAGVQARILAARYLAVSGGGYLGYPFVKDDGSYNGSSSAIACSPTDGGYGVAGFRATLTVPAPSTTLALFIR